MTRLAAMSPLPLIIALLGAAMTVPATAAPHAPSGVAALPHILVLATGGTIAGQAGSALAKPYHASGVDVGQLIAAAPGIDRIATLSGEQVASIGSQDMALPVWRRLAERIAAGRADPAVDGIVVTHGTDTLEETAFLLDLVLPAGKPVVLVGAMRPGNALSADGPGNLVEAVRVAADGASRDRGVLVVLNDAVHGARAVRKARTTGVDAFRSFPTGPIGTADPAGTRYFAPATLTRLRGRFALPATGALPRVAIVYAHADMDFDEVARQLSGAAGIVLAGVGNGNAPGPLLDLLAAAARAGTPVARTTRVGEGFVDRNVEVDDDAMGFIAARDLNPQKSRLLLQLLLAQGRHDPAALQAAFDPD
jgi:L-asparaginase